MNNDGVALDLPGRPEAQSSAGVDVVGALVGYGVVESRLRQVKMQSLCYHKTACLYVTRKSVEEKKSTWMIGASVVVYIKKWRGPKNRP